MRFYNRLRLPPLRRPVESTQYLSIRYTERLAEAGIERSVGSAGDSYDNAMAESVIGLFKTEVIRRRGPWRASRTSSSRRWRGSPGTTTTACSSPSATCHRPSSSRLIMTVRLPQTVWRSSTNRASEKAGTVQTVADTDVAA